MLNLHPLELRFNGELEIVFKFRGASGELEFPFTFEWREHQGSYNLNFATDEFLNLTSRDPCNYLVDWCVGSFFLARQRGLWFQNRKCVPVKYKFCGEPYPDALKYIVVLRCDEQTFEEQILVDYRGDDDWRIVSSEGRDQMNFNGMSELELIEPLPKNANLLQSILYFDELRYFRTCKEDVPFKEGVDYSEQF